MMADRGPSLSRRMGGVDKIGPDYAVGGRSGPDGTTAYVLAKLCRDGDGTVVCGAWTANR